MILELPVYISLSNGKERDEFPTTSLYYLLPGVLQSLPHVVPSRNWRSGRRSEHLAQGDSFGPSTTFGAPESRENPEVFCNIWFRLKDGPYCIFKMFDEQYLYACK